MTPKMGPFQQATTPCWIRHELLHIEGQSSIITGSSRGNSNPSLFILNVFWLPLPPWFDNDTATSRKRICLFQSFHVGKSQGTRMYGCIWMRLDSYAFLSVHVENKLIETCSSKKEKSQPLNFVKFRPLQKKHPEVEKVSDSNPFCEQPNRDFNHPWIRGWNFSVLVTGKARTTSRRLQPRWRQSHLPMSWQVLSVCTFCLNER